jgi:bloom syndrome protein
MVLISSCIETDVTDYTFADCKSILNLISISKDLTEEQKERQKDNVNEVMRFCMNKSDCRRSQVLRFFNETFDPAECDNACDVCLSRAQNVYEQEDVSADAVLVLKMMSKLDRNDQITVAGAVDVWRGMNRANIRKYSGNPYYGAGKAWEKVEAERLVQFMLIEKALAEFTVTNFSGWSNSYLKVS